jgi:transcriptional regulator CtsR
MGNLADDIEAFLKRLLRESNTIEIQRATLASKFNCAPSQINYVMTTRFTPVHGYMVESRRGGGGYIRIVRLNMEKGEAIHTLIHQRIGQRLTQEEAMATLSFLRERKLITEREASIMAAALTRETLGLDTLYADRVRASILKAMLLALQRH